MKQSNDSFRIDLENIQNLQRLYQKQYTTLFEQYICKNGSLNSEATLKMLWINSKNALSEFFYTIVS